MAGRKKSAMIPKDAVKRLDNILAHGEQTGHFHEAVGDGVVTYGWDGRDDLILYAPSGASVKHQEHGSVEMLPGQYDVTRVQEYSHFDEEARSVED